MRSSLCLLLALPLAIPAQAPVPTLRATNSEVLLDLVVRDKHAQIVHDLKPEEIQIFEDGTAQKLRSFYFYDGRASAQAPQSAAASGTVTAPPIDTTAASPTVNELRGISVVSVVISNLDPRGRKLATDAMADFIKNQLEPNTFVGVFTLGIAGLRMVQPYTNDGVKISAAVTQISNNALMGQLTRPTQLSLPATGLGAADSPSSTDTANPNTAPGGNLGAADTGNASGLASSQATANASGPAAAIANLMEGRWSWELADAYTDSSRYLTPLRTLVQAQSEIPGRKVVLLFSAGLPVSADFNEMYQSVVSAANRSNVSIYAVDTRGETDQSNLDNSRRMLTNAANYSHRQMMLGISGGDQTITPGMVRALDIADQSIHADTNGNMRDLAEDTGGEMLPASLDLREPLQRAMEDVRTHYELSYSSTNPNLDGNFRKITVKVLRPGVTVFSRSGYYAVPLLDGRQLYPYEIATLKAINMKPDLHQFDFQTATLQFRSAMDQSQLDYIFQVPAHNLTITKDGQLAKVHVCVTALIKDEQGQVVRKISRDIPRNVAVAKIDELEQGIVSFALPFQLPAGHYTVETATVDRNSMKASVSRAKLDVEPANGLSMSDVSIVRRIDPAPAGQETASNPLEARGGTVTPDLSDRVSILTSGKVVFYAVAYPPLPLDAPVQTSLEIWHEGKLVMRSPDSDVSLDENGAASILASLPVTKLTPGQYEAHITFHYKESTVTKRLAFTIALGS